MDDPLQFRSWLGMSIDAAPSQHNSIPPLIGLDQLSLKDAQAAPLVALLADVIESTCVGASFVVPATHANAA